MSPPPQPGPGGCGAAGTRCLPPSQRDPARGRPHGAAALGVDMAGRPPCLCTWPRAQDAGPEPPPGPARAAV